MLKMSGCDVKRVEDIGLKSAADEKVFEFAVKEERAIITHDKEFMNVNKRLIESPGIILIRLKNQSPANVFKHLISFLHSSYTEKLRNSLIILKTKAVVIKSFK